MFEQDYIMRLIKEMVRTILKLLFNIDSEQPTIELLEDHEEKSTLEVFLNMVDAGEINEAENRIFTIIETGNKTSLKWVLLFYSYLNEKTDEFLAENNFSRKEIQDDLKYVLSQYGLGSMTEMFLT